MSIMGLLGLKCMLKSIGVAMLKVCDGLKMSWIQIKMGHPLARNGAALAPFRANGAHPSNNKN